MCSKNEATTKTQETQIKSITDNRSGIQNDLNQTKNGMKSFQKDLPELIKKQPQSE